MRTISGVVRTAVCGTALMLMALPGISAAAQPGGSARTAARFAGERHLMLFLTDPATGKPAAGVAGKVVITGPDQASSSKATLIVMGGHIGVDVAMPTPGKYTF